MDALPSSLVDLDVGVNSFQSSGMRVLFGSGSMRCTSLTRLKLNHLSDDIGLRGGVVLSTALQLLCTTLNHLDLQCCFELPGAIKHIFPGLKACAALSDLNLSDNIISGDELRELGQTLQKCTTLRRLHLKRLYVTAISASHLMGHLTLCTRLNSIDLYCNDIGSDIGQNIDGRIHQFVQALCGLQGLRWINLTRNSKSPEAQQVFAEMMARGLSAMQAPALSIQIDGISPQGQNVIRNLTMQGQRTEWVTWHFQ